MDTYRGTKQFDDVYAELVRVARNRELIVYEDVGSIMGVPRGPQLPRELSIILREICEDERRADRPMLSSVAVAKYEREPSVGFYKDARELGRLPEGQDEREFWRQELEATYKAWS